MSQHPDADPNADFQRWHDGELAAIEQVYADTISALRAAEIPVHATQTGGMNMALEISVRDGRLLLTDADGELSWEPQPDQGWSLGYYDGEDVMVWHEQPIRTELPAGIADAGGVLVHDHKEPETAVQLVVLGINLAAQTSG